MKTSAKQKIRTGLFTIVGLLLLIAGIYFIGKKRDMFQSTFVVYCTFRNVGGLQVGNNVRFVGINVGTVEGIRIVSDTQAQVTVRLQEKIKPFLRSNDIVSIGSEGLMGDKLLVINSNGDERAPLMKDGGYLASTEPMDMDKTMSKLNAIASNAQVITGSLASILGEVTQGRGSLGKLLYSDKLEQNLEKTVSTASQTLQSVQQGSQGFSQNMDALKHSFLLKGYFKRKERKAAEKAEEAREQQNQIKTK
jgi:phospholipid/cholesterol/gamma-HCH transport system substrate-binding protein